MTTVKKNKHALTIPQGTSVIEDIHAVPSWMAKDVGRGLENIGTEDLEIPRLKLIQGLSPELEQYNKLRPGHFFHTAAEHIFDKPFRVVPVYMDRRYILWNPREAGGGILARADDGVHWAPAGKEFTVKLDKKDGGATVKWKTAKTVAESGLAEWGSMDPNDTDSAPAATLMYSFVLAFPDHPDLMPAVLSFQRSSIKVGRRFNTKLKTIRAPMFGLIFEISSMKDTNPNGDSFQNIQITGAGLVGDETAYKNYKGLHESFASKGLAIKDLENAQDDYVDAAADDQEEHDAPTDRTGKKRGRF